MVGSVELEGSDLSSVPSFWECREYQRTVRRVDTSNKLCNELAQMIHERAEVERAYAANLKRWSSKWLSFLDSGLEYGSTASAWKGLCVEAEAVSNAHKSVQTQLIDELLTGLKHWQKEHFHKTSLPPHTIKEAKLFEQDFEQAQKPWAKRLRKVYHGKKEYHHACKMERSLQVQVQNAKNDPSGTPEQLDENPKLKKMQDKLKKAEKEVERTRSNYTTAINDLDAESPRYLEEMTKVFNRTQEFERERLTYFKNLFTNMQQALNVTLKANFKTIYTELEESIALCDIDYDLNLWSSKHGVDMPAMFPKFEEYSPELHTISGKKRSQVSETNSTVTLTAINPVISSPSAAATEAPASRSNNGVSTNGPKTAMPTPFDDYSPSAEVKTFDQTDTEPVSHSGDDNTHDADELTDADYYASATYDDGRPGVRVRALYNYTGQEDDELTLVVGEVFEKLEDADDQGWCKGRKNGQCGLYPANYAEPI
uniref:Protein kinase C/casein kinase substrate neurons (Antigen EG13) n=1 Tax=Cryptocotyle lingua TaxID=66766 RepID=A0A7U0YES0_9TREM|nr:protein kinase C/casein kinase substrate neurons (antigen EG13) [Cryptocotyle lingua]